MSRQHPYRPDRIRRVLELHAAGQTISGIRRTLKHSPRTLRRIVGTATNLGWSVDVDPASVAWRIAEALSAPTPRESLRRHRTYIMDRLKANQSLTSIYTELQERGVDVSYSTLYRFAVSQCDFGKRNLARRLPPIGSGLERRGGRRLRGERPLVVVADHWEVSVVPVNISETGACLELPLQFWPRVFLLRSEDAAVGIQARIVWQRPREASQLVGVMLEGDREGRCALMQHAAPEES